MKYIKGFTFTPACRAVPYSEAASKESLRLLKETTSSDTVILVLGALQDTAHSEYVTWWDALDVISAFYSGMK